MEKQLKYEVCIMERKNVTSSDQGDELIYAV